MESLRLLHEVGRCPGPESGSDLACGIGLGSNLGDRLANLRSARQQLLATAEFVRTKAVLCASIYETEPIDCPPDSAPFLNTVLELEVSPNTPPAAILQRLQAIESALGRPSLRPRNSSRVIDLDLLYLGQLRFTSSDLTVPHPRWRERRFVLAPLAEIRPELILRGENRTVAELWRTSADTSRVARLQTIW